MKYLFIILAIVCLATVASLLAFLPGKHPPQAEIALSINGRDIARDAVDREVARMGYHARKPSDVYDTLITRELLIQEAERQKIDKEESFRKALKDFYENSLIKILLDRKNQELHTSVSDAEIDGYLALSGKQVTFTRLDTVPSSSEAAATASGSTSTVLFDKLSTPFRLLLSSLEPGQFAVYFNTGTERQAIRLDEIKPSTDPFVPQIDRQRITEMFEEYKKEQQMNAWLAELQQKAAITIYDSKQ